MSAAAIGLRTEFKVHANSTAPGSSSPWGPRTALSFQVQHAKQREQPACRIEIHIDLALQSLAQNCRAFVVESTAAHVQRFDLMGGRIADRFEITVADQEIVLDDAAKRGER